MPKGPLRPPEPAPEHSRPARLIQTQTLLDRAMDGDANALEVLCTRYLPRLRSWATRRLPDSARYRMDTEDLVQEVMISTIQNLDGLEESHPNAFLAYLRQGIMRRVGNEVRNARVRRDHAQQESSKPQSGTSSSPSPLDEVVGKETIDSYERGLEALSSEEQDLVIARVELGFSYREIALHTGRPSEDAVRMACKRALLKLAQEMGRHE